MKYQCLPNALTPYSSSMINVRYVFYPHNIILFSYKTYLKFLNLSFNC